MSSQHVKECYIIYWFSKTKETVQVTPFSLYNVCDPKAFMINIQLKACDITVKSTGQICQKQNKWKATFWWFTIK